MNTPAPICFRNTVYQWWLPFEKSDFLKFLHRGGQILKTLI